MVDRVIVANREMVCLGRLNWDMAKWEVHGLFREAEIGILWG